MVYHPVFLATKYYEEHIRGILCSLGNNEKGRPKEKRKNTDREQKKMKQTNEATCAQGTDRVLRTRLLFAGTISPMLCPADGQHTTSQQDQTEGKRTRRGHRQRADNKHRTSSLRTSGSVVLSRATQPTQRGQTQTARGSKNTKRQQSRRKRKEEEKIITQIQR